MAKLPDTLAALARFREYAGSSTAGETGTLRDLELKSANPGELRMRLHVPEQLQPGAALVVVLHGCSQTAEGYAVGAGWIALADDCGFAVLCPEQSRGNNPNLCFNWFEPQDTRRGGGEAASIAAMIAQAVADHGLDAKRVFITGLSAGGAMTAVMLATYPELFEAGSIFAGLPYGAASNMNEAFQAMFQGVRRPAQAWGDQVRNASRNRGRWPRVSIWHGDADTVVQPGAADELVKQWTNVHGATASEVEAGSSGRRTRVWRSAHGEPVVALHQIATMGHGTPLSAAGPDGYGAAGAYLLEVGVGSSLELATQWGLAENRRRSPARATQAAPAWRARGAPKPSARASPAPGVEVSEVIAKALRAAGLSR